MPPNARLVGSSSLRVAAGLGGLLLGLLPVSAQYTNYYSCPGACSPAPASNCLYNCQVSGQRVRGHAS